MGLPCGILSRTLSDSGVAKAERAGHARAIQRAGAERLRSLQHFWIVFTFILFPTPISLPSYLLWEGIYGACRDLDFCRGYFLVVTR